MGRLSGARRVADVLSEEAIAYGLTFQNGARLLLDLGSAASASLGFRTRDATDGIYSAAAGYIATPDQINAAAISTTDAYASRLRSTTPSATQNIVAATNTILANASTVQISADAPYTLTSQPTIADGVLNGQDLTIVNVGAFAVTLQRGATYNLQLGAITRTLGQYSALVLIWSTTIGDWVETSFKS